MNLDKRFDDNKYPRVLIVSHNCFSMEGSNGRTLANLFYGYPNDRLAQFYIYNEFPHSEVCMNYYRVTDKQALKAMFFSSDKGEKISFSTDLSTNTIASAVKPKIKKTPFVYLVREIIWRRKKWYTVDLKKWIDDFSPEILFFQAGDAGFLFDFAYSIAKERSIPLVVYNSESYYFKEKNYLLNTVFSFFWYWLLHMNYVRIVRRTLQYASHRIYITDSLREAFEKEFPCYSTTILPSSSIEERAVHNESSNIRIAYLGNLGVGRKEVLMELAGILQSINPKYIIDVYGNYSEVLVEQLQQIKGLNYKGFISYDECVRVMVESDILIHVESFSEFFLEDSKYAFSTKIADSLSCGSCLFVYAPLQLFSTQYLISKCAACVAVSKDEAKEKIKCLINNPQLRIQYGKRGKEVAIENHSIIANRNKTLKVLRQVYEGERR